METEPLNDRKTWMDAELLRREGMKPTAVITLNAHETASCVCLDRTAVRLLIEKLKDIHREMRNR